MELQELSVFLTTKGKTMNDNTAANCQQGPTTGAGDALQSPYSKDYLEEMAREREASRQRHGRDQRLNIFAEILRARPNLSPEAAADAASKVYGKLTD
jgi:hypothetical protein